MRAGRRFLGGFVDRHLLVHRPFGPWHEINTYRV